MAFQAVLYGQQLYPALREIGTYSDILGVKLHEEERVMYPALREIGTYSDPSYPQVQILAFFFHFRHFSPLFEAENRLCEGLGKNV